MQVPLRQTLRYGRSEISFYLKGTYRVETLVPSRPALRLDENEILKIRLRNPLATRPLEEILRPGDRVLLVVPDKTRVARLDVVLPFLMTVFQQKKIPDDRVGIVFASGSHSRMSEAEKKEILGDAAYSRFALFEHNCWSGPFKEAGKTRRGTPVWVNSILYEYDRVVVIGPVVHHYFAGFGGGPKMIVPGLASHQTIEANHRLAVQSDEGPLHPACRPGNLEKNPVYEDIQEAAQLVRPIDFAIQLVLDEQNGIVDAFCGDLFSSFQKAGLRVNQINCVEIDEQADVVIASAGGYPKDVNLIQTHKAIHHSVQALKPGGILLLAAECKEGVGNPDLPGWFRFPNFASMKQAVMRDFHLNANTALALKHKLMQYKVLLVSELDHDLLRNMGFYPFRNFEQALETVEKIMPPDPLIYIIPNASITLPVTK